MGTLSVEFNMGTLNVGLMGTLNVRLMGTLSVGLMGTDGLAREPPAEKFLYE